MISELTKPVRVASARTTNRTPFDAQLHQPKAPIKALAAQFADGVGGSDDEFENLKKWARTTPLDGTNWPDFKRLYKAIEARLWPPMGRFRWDKSENDFPATPLPSERELELLGVLMGRLDQINAWRGGQSAPPTPQLSLAQRAIAAASNLVGRNPAPAQNGPSADTLAYMKRRATRLLTFLRDNKGLSAERRAALAPLVSGLLQRDTCPDINATLPLRLKLAETDVLAAHPDAIARIWNDVTVAIHVLAWSYNWLEARGQTVAVSPRQLRRFVEVADARWTLTLAPAALQSDEKWPSDFDLKLFSQILQGIVKGRSYSETRQLKEAFLARRGEIVNLFARFPQLELDERWLRDSLAEVSDPVTLDWLMPWLSERARNGEFALIEKMSAALQSRFNRAIVAAHPNGFPLEKWRELVDNAELLRRLTPALREIALSDEIVNYLWALEPARRTPVLRALDSNSNLVPLIRERAAQRDWKFAAPLAPLQWERFARVVGQNFADGLSAADWVKIAELPFESGYNLLPLGAGFWGWVLPLESAKRARWIERVGAPRAGREFAGQSAAIFEELLDSDATGLDALGDAWLDAHLEEVPLGGELIIKLAQSAVSDWQARALQHLQSATLRLPVALRLMESELPILERVAAPFFEDESTDWSERVLALADSPKMAARQLALQLLEKYPARWTRDLLGNLAQHDDAGIQAFVAAQLKNAPATVVESQAVAAFDEAILNARGRARRAKSSVQMRLSDGEADRETLLTAARNGAPRDREWALQQLVKAAMAGAEVEGLEVEGAFIKAD